MTEVNFFSPGDANITSVIIETMASIKSTIVKGFIKASISLLYRGLGFSWEITFLPYFSLSSSVTASL